MMNDPMAGIDTNAADAPSITAADEMDSKEVFEPMILQSNLQRIERVRSVMGIASGCMSGIAGLTGWEGLSKFSLLWIGKVAGGVVRGSTSSTYFSRMLRYL